MKIEKYWKYEHYYVLWFKVYLKNKFALSIIIMYYLENKRTCLID